MKRLEIKNNQINFIGIWDLENNELCKNIINFFEKNIDLQKDGATGDGKKIELKKTTDINIHPNNLKDEKFIHIKNYIKELHNCYLDYQEQSADRILSILLEECSVKLATSLAVKITGLKKNYLYQRAMDLAKE